MDTFAELYDKKLIEDIDTNTKNYLEKVFVERILKPYRRYLKTTYSKEFTRKLVSNIIFENKLTEIELSGVSGIGKTCTTLHFVLNNIFKKSANYLDIVYVDVNEVRYCIEDGGLAHEKLNTFFKGSKRPDCVIIDHVTSRAEKVLSKIKGEGYVCLVNYIIGQVKARKKIFIDTGYTAGICNSSPWSERFALSEEEFTRIWIEKLKFIENDQDCSKSHDDESLIHIREKCKSLYKSLQDFPLTPGLVHFAFDYTMGSLDDDDDDDVHVIIAYLNKLKKDIDKFTSMYGKHDEDIADLVTETSLIADIIKKGGILPLESFESRRCPVNIFTFETGKATREDCESNPAFLLHEMPEGEQYVKLSFIQRKASLTDWWMKKLTILPKHIAQLSAEALQRYSKSLGILYGRFLIGSQLEKRMFFIPNSLSPTSYIKTERNCEIEPEHLKIISMLAVKITLKEEESEYLTVDKKYKGQMKNVALHTKYLINSIRGSTTEQKLMHPSFINFLGVDYFLYIPSKYLWSNGDKKRKYNNVLILFKVTYDKNCGAQTIAAALDCVNEVIATELHGNNESFTIDVHVCFLILYKDSLTLKDCIQFNGATCISIANRDYFTVMTDECRTSLEAVMRKLPDPGK